MHRNLRISDIVDKLYKPIIIISAFVSVVTFLIYFRVFASESTLYSLLRHFNLNEANTIADWFSVLIWIVFGLSFYMLGMKELKTERLRKKDRLTLFIWGLLLCLVSFEKIFHIHLIFEFRAINLLGFFSPSLRKDSPYYWLYAFILPVLIIFLINLFITYYKLIKGISSVNLRREIIYLSAAGVILIPMSIGFDMLQGYYWYAGQRDTVFNSIESVLELVGICCFIKCNKIVKAYYTDLSLTNSL